MKFLVPNYSCLQNPWLGGYHLQIPVLSVLNLICWTPPPKKIPGYATDNKDDDDDQKCHMITCNALIIWEQEKNLKFLPDKYFGHLK